MTFNSYEFYCYTLKLINDWSLLYDDNQIINKEREDILQVVIPKLNITISNCRYKRWVFALIEKYPIRKKTINNAVLR